VTGAFLIERPQGLVKSFNQIKILVPVPSTTRVTVPSELSEWNTQLRKQKSIIFSPKVVETV